MSIEVPFDSWALMLDLDGTLVEFAEHPSAVVVPPELGGLLRRTQARLGGALALVSGRSMRQIDEMLSPHRFDAAALHGAEQRIGDVLDVRSSSESDVLRPAVARLNRNFAGTDGVVIEDKGASVAVHWRQVPQLEDRIVTQVQRILHDLAPHFRLQRGRSVAEIAPGHADSARAIRTFLAAPPYRGRRPVFIGDDRTDDSGFRTVTGLGGIAVQVGGVSRFATYRVPDPAAVRRCLATWAAGLPIDPDRDFDA